MKTQFSNVQNIKDAHANAGMHFFSPATMRFFASRIHSTRATYDGAGGWLFVESQKRGFEDYRRVFHVARFNETDNAVDMLRTDDGERIEFATPKEARGYIARAAASADYVAAVADAMGVDAESLTPAARGLIEAARLSGVAVADAAAGVLATVR